MRKGVYLLILLVTYNIQDIKLNQFIFFVEKERVKSSEQIITINSGSVETRITENKKKEEKKKESVPIGDIVKGKSLSIW